MFPRFSAVIRRLFAVFLITVVCAERGWAADAAPAPRIDVILWFDTEDYLLPADDDAAKRLAELLTARQVRATFKVVGEKARTLERRHRADVIAALKKHAIGYHANFHSVHPTPTEYLAPCGFLDGVDEFVRREGGGAADVRRIFDRATLACYGQPGSSWGAQAVAGLDRIGVAPRGTPCYVDEGSHVGLDNKPFYYDNAITVYHMGHNYTRMELHDPMAVEPGKKNFSEIAQRLAHEGGGLISIFYHPCEWVHQQFWDGVNFAHGANPPREEWKPPGQLPPEETNAAFRRFEEYIDFIRQTPGVRFITAEELPAIYPDKARSVGADEAAVSEIASRILRAPDGQIGFQVVGEISYSAADQFELLARAVATLTGGKEPKYPLRASGVFGPTDESPASPENSELAWPAFRDAVRDVADFVLAEHRMPSRVFVGPDAVPPTDFMVGMARVWDAYERDQHLPESAAVRLGPGTRMIEVKHIAQDKPDVFGDWVIHRKGFQAPKVLEVAREQAWTLKPAIRAEKGK
jgi:hypothetical protein